MHSITVANNEQVQLYAGRLK